MSSENNVDNPQKHIQAFLDKIKTDMIIGWDEFTPFMRKNFTRFNKQDWRDFAQTLLESTYEEYVALDGYYLAPSTVHIIQEELDKFATTFPSWFKENFNDKEKEKEGIKKIR